MLFLLLYSLVTIALGRNVDGLASFVRAEPQLVLVTSFPPYHSTPTHRAIELLQSFQMNVDLNAFAGFIVFEQAASNTPRTFATKLHRICKSSPSHPALIVRKISTQPTYKILLATAQKWLKGKVVVVAHADIYFDQTILCARKLVNNANTMMALSRQPSPFCPTGSSGASTQQGVHFVKNLCEDYYNSHDAFIFKSPASVDVSQLSIHPNRFGAENVFIRSFKLAGYQVMNPCKDVHALHYHCHQGFDPGPSGSVKSLVGTDIDETWESVWKNNVGRQPPNRVDCSRIS